MNNPLISILIPTLDRPEKLKRTLDFIGFNTEYRPYEIVITIDGGEYGFLQDYKEANGQRIIVERNPRKLDTVKSINRAADISSGKYLLWLGDDVDVCPRWMYFAWKEMRERFDGYGMIGLHDGWQPHLGCLALIHRGLWERIRTDVYSHYYFDDEMTEKADFLKLYHKSFVACAIHWQRGWGDPEDDTEKNSLSTWGADQALFNSRKYKGWEHFIKPEV